MASNKIPDIPGFYFDQEKNRYFRLLPGQEHKNPLTGDTITNGKKKRKRASKKKHQNKRKMRNKPPSTGYLLNQLQIGKCSSDIFQRIILQNMIKDKLHQNTILSLTPEIEGVWNDDFFCKEFKVSEDSTNLLFQTEINSKPSLAFVDKICQKRRKFKYSTLPFDCGTNLLDYTHAQMTKEKNGFLFCSLFNMGVSVITLVPDITASNFVSKRVYGTPFVCAWKQHSKIFSYSLDWETLVVTDVDRHFSRSSSKTSSCTEVSAYESRVAALDFSSNNALIYNGLINGKIVAHDWRCQQNAEITLQPGANLRNAACIKELKHGNNVISGHYCFGVSILLWDVRNPKNPVIKYPTNNPDRQMIAPDMSKYFYIDSMEHVLSYTDTDRTLRLLDIYTGKLLLETSKIDGGMYADAWCLIDNEPGVLGLNNGSFVWWPLRCNAV